MMLVTTPTGSWTEGSMCWAAKSATRTSSAPARAAWGRAAPRPGTRRRAIGAATKATNPTGPAAAVATPARAVAHPSRASRLGSTCVPSPAAASSPSWRGRRACAATAVSGTRRASAPRIGQNWPQDDLALLARSPFCAVSTSDAAGNCDVTPRGDGPGFTHVLDPGTLALPDRPGNRRADSFHNILSNPHVGLLYLIPGAMDVLRVNGRARILTDAPFFDAMTLKGQRPKLALVVEIDEIFRHCSNALRRSGVWAPETWEGAADRPAVDHRPGGA
ncbi:hypothetical protein SCYAM73S_07015 [Streptomyces cyaneofuscatus]